MLSNNDSPSRRQSFLHIAEAIKGDHVKNLLIKQEKAAYTNTIIYKIFNWFCSHNNGSKKNISKLILINEN